MRKIKKRNLIYAINYTSIPTFFAGAGGIIASLLGENINRPGVIFGLSAATIGMATHLITTNIDYKDNEIAKDLEEKKNNVLYRYSLLKEQEKLEKFEFHIECIINNYTPEENDIISNDYYTDVLLIEKKIELLDLDYQNDKDDVEELYEYIDELEKKEKSQLYKDLKNNFFIGHNSSINNFQENSNGKVLYFRKNNNK